MAISQERIDALTNIGLIYNGDSFIYRDVNVHWTEVLTIRDKEFNDLIGQLHLIVADRKAREKDD